MKCSVTHRALYQRLQRRLAANGLTLKGDVSGSDRWYVLKGSEVIEQHSSLITLAYHYNVVRSYEEYMQ